MTDLERENRDLRRALGAVKMLALQRDLRGIDEELAGYVLDWDKGEPVVASAGCQSSGGQSSGGQSSGGHSSGVPRKGRAA